GRAAHHGASGAWECRRAGGGLACHATGGALANGPEVIRGRARRPRRARASAAAGCHGVPGGSGRGAGRGLHGEHRPVL
ncbi:MAG: hypothetical protein AVDCRST_MAG77-3070, partial [uncultured Chloroflexi bacterium]